jgi:tryptophan synthase alpha chain
MVALLPCRDDKWNMVLLFRITIGKKMSRTEKTFKSLNRPALITYIMAGDPDYARGLAVLKSLPAAGADIIELGMPFTDPMADGPVIQAAGLRAIASGTTVKTTLKMVTEFRAVNKDTPIVLMGYANPIFIYGIEQFAKDAAIAGVDGLLIVDLPPEESAELKTLAKKNDLDFIRLVTPTTDETRLPAVLSNASGFIYYVSVAGITGAAKADPKTLKPRIAEIRKHTNLPIAIGFGVKTAEDVRALSDIGDGVIVGSSIVQRIDENKNNPALTENVSNYIRGLSGALKGQ